MAEVNHIAEAFKFMLLGMGVVFIFLSVLVLCIKLQAYLINKYFPETPKPSVAPVATTSDDEQRRVAAIIAAVAEFRKNKS